MNNTLNLDIKLVTIGQMLENQFRLCRGMPQYKYLTVPVYKMCVEKVGNVAATGISFLVADLIMHQLIPQTLICLASYIGFPQNEPCHFSYSYIKSLFWLGLALPVMYAKYKRTF